MYTNNNKILIVDDDVGVLSNIKELLMGRRSEDLGKSSKELFGASLGEEDFEIYTASDDKEGLKIFNDHLNEGDEFGLAILDLRMEGEVKGVDLALTMRKINPNLEIIFITSGDYSYKETVGKVGKGIQYVNKPFNSMAFTQAVKKGLYEYNRSASFQSLAYLNLESAEGTKLRSLGSFFSVYLQDFRNLQNGIFNSLELIKDDNCSKEELEIITEMVKNSLMKMHNYIEDFGIFFNKLKVNKAHFSLNELFLVIKGELAPECLKENIKIEIKVEDDIDAYGDVGLIKKSLIHLLKNSIQALKKSDSENRLIEVKTEERGQIIEIEDNGPGIPEESLNYSQFWKLDVKNFPKSGLGLPFVNKVMKAHGGSMTVVSNKGKSVVILSLPEEPSEKKSN